MLDGWRYTWATTGIVVAVGLFVEGLSWATATPPRPALDLWLIFGFAFLGLVVFLIAMIHPTWILGYKHAKGQEEKRDEERHQNERKRRGQLDQDQHLRDFMNPHFTEDRQNRALDRHSEALERWLSAQESKEAGSDEEDSGL